jgi:hypothetical protein
MLKLLSAARQVLTVLWEVLGYLWTYVLWRTPTSYPGGECVSV